MTHDENMNKIKILSDNLANQIAAGEVVERPASVIKELVENSIDAGAKRIQVDIELGGRRLMRVSDDGEGMLRDDAILAFERHATSKIKSLEDLGAISTLGFRGEALASIASVAKIELITKTENDLAATRVVIEGGKLIDVKEAARNTGTTLNVRDLFFNTPARRKFMRSEATENYHLTAIIQHYALAHPEIAFTLTSNGREVLRVSPARDLRERAYQIFGGNLIESLLPVSGGREFIAKVSGFVSAPRERRTTRDSQYFFVNQRFVKDKVVAGGLLEGFRAVLPHGVYPVAFLFLDIPHDEIDVNVHPAKTEVRFRRSEAVKETIAEAVREALARAGIVRAEEERRNRESEETSAKLQFENIQNETTISNSVVADINPNYTQTEINFQTFQNESTDFSLNDTVRIEDKLTTETLSITEQVLPTETEFASEVFSNDFEQKANNIETENFRIENENIENPVFRSNDLNEERVKNYDRSAVVMPPVNSAEKVVKAAEVADFSASKIRPIGQLHNSFIIAVDDEGMLLIDQHVAHERILFDKFRKKETERKIESQNLLLPETFDLTPAQSQSFSVVEEELENLGFGLMRLSGRTVAIKSVPTDLPPAEARNLLAEILDTVDNEKRGQAKASLRDDIAASLACKAAVKINMKLTPEKMQWLIDRLLITSSPTTCPHGRPVILRLTMKDIERGFHRT
ncbi:MAG: DNA mismatch repair endonuclease MutL [Pyrinomonadaceae bacterium]|nr:DNA mismatch repair endonuclease MutL [Pyrinomonadaceae bacterium]